MKAVRRLLCSLILAGVAVSLHASVPSVNSPGTLNRSANPKFESSIQATTAPGITAAPADVSFYDEFFPATSTRQEQPKTGVLHWFGSLIKKGRQKIALLSPQKFF
jgi:hypothetical protein